MMQHEFEKIAGIRVSVEAYDNEIEPLYMALDLSKEEFVKRINLKHYALPTEKQLIAKMRKAAKVARDNAECGGAAYWDACDAIRTAADRYVELYHTAGAFALTEDRTTGDWYWGPACAGRGCSFPVAVEICNKDGGTIEKIVLLKAPEGRR